MKRRVGLQVAGALIAASFVAGGTAVPASASDVAYWGWGDNQDAELGDGTTSSPRSSPLPIAQAGPGSFTSLAAGGNHACGLTILGESYCWGDNLYGQVGEGSFTIQPFLTPQRVSIGTPLVSLAAGAGHTCGLTASGIAYCWGDNTFGQLGTGNFTSANTPQLVSMPSGVTFVGVAAGRNHSCGMTSAGAAYCWGYNFSGQLGIGTTSDASSPQAVSMPSGVTFTRLGLGGYQSCGLTSSGAAYCWGRNADGQLGDGSITDKTTPTAVTMPSGASFTSLAAGERFTCGLTSADIAYCWGNNTLGSVGVGNLSSPIMTPQAVSVPAGVAFVSIAAGSAHACGLSSSGAAYCWGDNVDGQLGLGTIASPYTSPQSIEGGLRLASIISGPASSSTYGFPLRAASGDSVPRAALQQFARAEADSCDAQPDDLVDFPALGAVRHQAWGMSWAQWPNGGTGGFVCTRQPYYTSIGTWAVE